MIVLKIQCQEKFLPVVQDATLLLQARLTEITAQDTEINLQATENKSTVFELEFTGDLPAEKARYAMQGYTWGFLEGLLLNPKDHPTDPQT